jgi:hypothetical protein
MLVRYVPTKSTGVTQQPKRFSSRAESCGRDWRADVVARRTRLCGTRGDRALLYSHTRTAASGSRAGPCRTRRGRCDGALGHAKTRDCAAGPVGWKRNATGGPVVASAWEVGATDESLYGVGTTARV